MLSRLEPHRALLLAAAEYMRKHGHCRGSHVGPGGTVCAMAAVVFAAEGRDGERNLKPGSLINVSIDALARYVGGPVWRWNDSHTAEEVIAGMEGAALAVSPADACDRPAALAEVAAWPHG